MPGRCDAVAVAVGLIDRKHVGVVGANRDAAAAKGDREYLHPVHTSAPLKPPGFPHRYVCLWCAEQLFFLFFFFKKKKKKNQFEPKGAPNGCCGKPCSPARYLHIVFDLAYKPETPWWNSRNYEDCCCNGVDSLTAQSPSVNLQHLVSWRFAGCSVSWASPRFFSELLLLSLLFIIIVFCFVFS